MMTLKHDLTNILWTKHIHIDACQGPAFMMIRTLLIDNYDSYTYNLFQLISIINGVDPLVVKNDRINLEQISQYLKLGYIHNIVISPGPGTPLNSRDVGICPKVFQMFPNVPIFGVCLGFQSLCIVHGHGKIVKASEPIHGRLSKVVHSGHALFEGIPSGFDFDVVRYHSLCIVEESLNDMIVPIAWTDGHNHALSVDAIKEMENIGQDRAVPRLTSERILMGVSHKNKPHFGVQFHPESVATAYGHTLLSNFRDITMSHMTGQHASLRRDCIEIDESHIRLHDSILGSSKSWERNGDDGMLSACCKRAGITLSSIKGGAQRIVEELYLSTKQPTSPNDIFWLDSSSQERSRFSFIGGRGGPMWKRVSYALYAPMSDKKGGELEIVDAEGTMQHKHCDSIWDWISEQSSEFQVFDANLKKLPFGFWGGLVGYLGYELKAESGGRAAHISPNADACFFIVDRFIAVDHETGDIYIVAVYNGSHNCASSEIWVNSTASTIENLKGTDYRSEPGTMTQRSLDIKERHSHQRYVAKIEKCLEALMRGESYELCMTNMLYIDGQWDAWSLYSILRQVNPAPYSAYLDFSLSPKGPKICCSSPERFLQGSLQGQLEAKPIKGTAKRDLSSRVKDEAAAYSLLNSEKDRAENLMIVDLLRNDLGSVCESGSVHVPSLMQIETFATVHQMVSTIRGNRRKSLGIGQVIQSCFPGGSMTGAPKVRSMEILDTLEEGPRGIYSGSIGYISWNEVFDLNIVIRTAIVNDSGIMVGAGGAIVVQSDPKSELEEMKIKAEPILHSISCCQNI